MLWFYLPKVTMSTSERTPERSIFDVYREMVVNFMNEMDKARPAYIQSITNLQHQAIDSLRKLTELTLNVQRDFIEPIRLPTLPEAWIRGSEEFNDALAKTTSVTNKVIITGIDTATQSIKLATDAFETIIKINQNILKSIRGSLTPSRES